jgi:hypothetical protein
MDTSELRKRILRALDDARQQASVRRQVVDQATKAYDSFLAETAAPVMRQAANVLTSEGHLFTVETPAGRARIVSARSPETFIELSLDTAGDGGVVLGRVSLSRGRHGLVVEERPIGGGKPVAALTEDDLSAFLVSEIPKLILRT